MTDFNIFENKTYLQPNLFFDNESSNSDNQFLNIANLNDLVAMCQKNGQIKGKSAKKNEQESSEKTI